MKNNSFLSEKLLLNEFDNHELISFIYDGKTCLKGFIAIHRLNKNNPSFGATRLWRYSSPKEALLDAIRLSKIMSYKAALSGLPCGGAKAVLIDDGNISNKKIFLKEYAHKVNLMKGIFVTGSDVGLSKDDVITMRKTCPYFVGTKTYPERYTALGLYYSIIICLKHVFGNSDIRRRSFAIQGLGKVGLELLKLISSKGGNIFVSEIDKEKINLTRKLFPKIKVVKPDEIDRIKVDVYSHCALSHAINYKNLSNLRSPIIAGGANNQLENKEVGELLHKIGILYAPDYIVNSGGLISVYDEYLSGNSRINRVIKKIKRIPSTLNRILLKGKRERKPPFAIADEMAEKIFNNFS